MMHKGLVLLLASVVYLEAVIAANVCHLSEDIRPTEGACKDHAVKSRFCVKDEAAGKKMASSAKTYLEGSTITSATCNAKYDTMCAAAGGTRKVTRTSCEFLCSQGLTFCSSGPSPPIPSSQKHSHTDATRLSLLQTIVQTRIAAALSPSSREAPKPRVHRCRFAATWVPLTTAAPDSVGLRHPLPE
jgi:hypothetical protein